MGTKTEPTAHPVPNGGALTYPVPYVAKLLGISRNGAYEAILRGEIPSLKFGRRVVVPRAAFHSMFDAQPAGETK